MQGETLGELRVAAQQSAAPAFDLPYRGRGLPSRTSNLSEKAVVWENVVESEGEDMDVDEGLDTS